MSWAVFSVLRILRKMISRGGYRSGNALYHVGWGIKSIPVIGGVLAKVANPLVFVGVRFVFAGRGIVIGTISVVEGAVHGLAKLLGELGGGFVALFRGDVRETWKRFKGAGKALVRAPIDALLMGMATTVSTAQTAAFLEPVGRRLRSKEIIMLKYVFGDSIDYEVVTIKEGPAGVARAVTDRAFVAGNTIYLQKPPQDPDEFDGLLVHEMTHVWQHQHGGTGYMIDALVAQRSEVGYDWQKSAPKTLWADLNPEQQAQLLEDAQVAGFFFDEQDQFLVNAINYTAYLNNALREVRLGRGAP